MATQYAPSLPGQVLESSSATNVQAPPLSRALSTPATPRLQGFIVNWCRFRNSHPILGSFHHVNNSNLLRRGTNKFFEEMLVTPIQYQEVKRLRHNPYVGGGYIRSHDTLFHDLHLGYWAKERMAAREKRKRHMVSEMKRPRIEQEPAKTSAAPAPAPAPVAMAAGSGAASTTVPAGVVKPRPLGMAALVAGSTGASPPAALTSAGAGASSVSSDAATTPHAATKSIATEGDLPQRTPLLVNFSVTVAAEDEQKTPHEGGSPRSRHVSFSVPASVLDIDHGKSRQFEDFYTFEKCPPMSVRTMPKVRAGSGSQSPVPAALTAEAETKVATEAQLVRQLGTEAKSGAMVGRGAYSSVRVGTHISTGDRFAIKQISKRFLYSEEEREAIRREVRIHCSPELVHDNIVFLYDYFEDSKAFYLVLDHCEGGDLETYMRLNKRKGVTELQAQMLFQQVMKALAFLHDQNIIHGDIKPQNVLLSKKPFAVVKICDFGNARYAKDVRYFQKTGSVSKVPYTSITGTAGYIAPEILAKKHYGTGIDVWAAGIMCFKLLGGYQPYNPPSACLTSKTGTCVDRVTEPRKQPRILTVCYAVLCCSQENLISTIRCGTSTRKNVKTSSANFCSGIRCVLAFFECVCLCHSVCTAIDLVRDLLVCFTGETDHRSGRQNASMDRWPLTVAKHFFCA